jgi:CheY-like chemotaxis protein
MKRIVVAESSPTIKNVADNLLRQNGYNVVCTSDGLQAWEVVKSEKPDLVLAGLNLSGMSGLDLCRQIAGDSATGGIPVVVMVGSRDNASEDKLIKAGIRGKLKKPFSPRDLLTVVNKMIGAGDPEVPAPRREGMAREKKQQSQVLSATRPLDESQNKVYNLDWADLSHSGPRNVELQDDGTEIGAPENDDEILIDHNQFDLESLNARNDEQPAPENPDSADEDYDWFVGEMKKEGVGEKGREEKKDQQEPKGKVSDDKRNETRPASAADGGELKFEDFGPARAEKTSPDIKEDNRKSVPDNPPKTDPQPEPAGLTEDALSSIADKVVENLGAAIAANINRRMIIDAIKSVMKQRTEDL